MSSHFSHALIGGLHFSECATCIHATDEPGACVPMTSSCGPLFNVGKKIIEIDYDTNGIFCTAFQDRKDAY